MPEKIVHDVSTEKSAVLFGSYDENTDLIEKEYGVIITARENSLKVSGENSEQVEKAASALEYLLKMTDFNETLTEQNVRYVISMVNAGSGEELHGLDGDCICITNRGKPVKAKTVGQKRYIEAIKNNTVTLAIGPAGTGKTFLAVAMAVNALRTKQVSRIILTRPAVEAGEKLGFLPGDLQNKIDPYLRPLYDALYEMMGLEGYTRNHEKGAIEIAPLAYMRGRTLDDSFIILDEAQNTTPEQMKMFLTRFGFGSKAVVTGDITQIDLPSGQRSGLAEASKILKDIEGISIQTLTDKDVVRHALVQKIILAYERYEKEKGKQRLEVEKQDIYKKRPE